MDRIDSEAIKKWKWIMIKQMLIPPYYVWEGSKLTQSLT